MAKRERSRPSATDKAKQGATGEMKQTRPPKKGGSRASTGSRQVARKSASRRVKRQKHRRATDWAAEALAERRVREWLTKDQMLSLVEDESKPTPNLIYHADMDSNNFGKMFRRLKAFLDAEVAARRLADKTEDSEALSLWAGTTDAPFLITPSGVQEIKLPNGDKEADAEKPLTIADLASDEAIQPAQESLPKPKVEVPEAKAKPKPETEQEYFKSVWPEAAQAHQAVESYLKKKDADSSLPDPGDFIFNLHIRSPTVSDVFKLMALDINVGVLYPRSKVSLPWKELQYSKLPQDTSFWRSILWGNVGISVILGRVSNNLVCVDCDTKGAFFEVINALKEQGSPLFAVRSAKGGHIYFQADGELENIPENQLFWRDGNPACNIAIWGHSRYMVVPPSIHPSGYPYWWFMGNTTDRPPLISLLDDTQKKGVLSALFAGLSYHIWPTDKRRSLFDVAPQQNTSRHPLKNVYEYLQTPIAPGNRNNRMVQAIVAVYKWVESGDFQLDLIEQIRLKGLADGLSNSHVDGLLQWAYWNVEPNKDGKLISGIDGTLDLNFENRNMVWKHKRAQLFLDFYQFRGRGMLTDRAVAVSMLELARRSDSGYWRGSVREVAEIARMPYRTAHGALKRLEELEIIKRMGSDKRSGAITWGWGRRALGIGPFFDFFDALFNRTDQAEVERVRNSSNRYLKSLDDLSEAIGKSARFILEMCNGQSLSRDEIAARTNLTTSQVRRAMTGLSDAGLADYDRGKNLWTIEQFLAGDSDLLAQAAGTYGNGLKRKQQHAEERMWFIASKLLLNRLNRMGPKKRELFADHTLKVFRGHPKEQFIRNLFMRTGVRRVCADCGGEGWVWFMIDDGVTNLGVETMGQVPCRGCEPESFAMWMLSMGPGWDEYFEMRQHYDFAADFAADFGYPEAVAEALKAEDDKLRGDLGADSEQAAQAAEPVDYLVSDKLDEKPPSLESYIDKGKQTRAAKKAAEKAAEKAARENADAEAKARFDAESEANVRAKLKANMAAKAKEKAAAEKAYREAGKEFPTTFPPKPESLKGKRRAEPKRNRHAHLSEIPERYKDFDPEADKAKRLYRNFEEYTAMINAILDGDIELTDEMIIKDASLRQALIETARRRDIQNEALAKLEAEEQKAQEEKAKGKSTGDASDQAKPDEPKPNEPKPDEGS